MKVTVDELRSWIVRLLELAGVTPDLAEGAADIFTRASLRGVGHHDVSYLPQRLEWLTKGGVNPRPSFSLLRSFGATEVWDGDRGLGEAACLHAAFRAFSLAEKNGVGLATIRASNHFLAASPYVELGQERGFITLVISNTDPGMSAPGASGHVLGNNPLGFSAPREPDQPPLILDLCMAYSSLGHLKAQVQQQNQVPAYWGRDEKGRATTDPAQILSRGSVEPMAGHKGFGLALMNEVLTGIISGGAYGHHIQPAGGVNTHNQTVIALKMEAFGGRQELGERVEDLVEGLKKRVPDLRIPGERSRKSADEGLAGGILLSETLVETLKDWETRLSQG